MVLHRHQNSVRNKPMEQYLMAAIIRARILNLFYHHAHNVTVGPAFFQDHDFFAAAYGELELDYDKLAEYFIALNGRAKFVTKTINEVVEEQLSAYAVETMYASDMYMVALDLERKFQQDLELCLKKAPIGLQNAIGAMSELSDVRIYKMQQRLS